MDRRRVGCVSRGCSSPRKFMSRWLSSLRNAKGKISKMHRERGEDGAEEIKYSTDGLRGTDSSITALETQESDLHSKDRAINMGIGCYLLYLLAAGKDEIQKMETLRNEMEKFLEDAKENIRKQEGLLSNPPPETSEVYAYSTTDVVEGPESSNFLLSPQPITFPESSSSVHGGYLKHSASEMEQTFGEMDQLEAELEAELELLQLHLGPQKKHSKQRSKVAGEPIEEISEEEHRVCPYELERKLHEVLETRQHEQIKDLEAALESAKLMLHDKEAEISWWKDTAYLFSQNIPESSRLNWDRFSEIHPLSR